MEGKCEYGDALCWFIHEVDSNIPFQDATDLKCKKCDNTFKTRLSFMKHRKSEHGDSVPTCRNALNGSCEYGISKCWFIHYDSESESEHGNRNINLKDQEFTEKLLNMMEKFTQRIQLLKNQISNKNRNNKHNRQHEIRNIHGKS
jgi:hypothetical protein